MTIAVKINPFFYRDFKPTAAYEMCARNSAATNMFITPDDGRTWYVVLYIKKCWPSKYKLFSMHLSFFRGPCKQHTISFHSFVHHTGLVRNYLLSPSPVGHRIREAFLNDEKPIFAFMNVNWHKSTHDKVMQLQTVFVENTRHIAPFKMHFFGTERDLGNAAYYAEVTAIAAANNTNRDNDDDSNNDDSAGDDNCGGRGGSGKRGLGGSGKGAPARKAMRT
jgi:hypothetical protein